MDKNMKYVVLVAVGGVGVYLIWKGGYLAQWFPSVFGPGGPLATTPATIPTPSTPAPGIPRVPVLPPPPSPSGTNFPAAGTTSLQNGATYQADGKGGWTLIKAAPAAVQSCPAGQHWSTVTNTCVCDDGSTNTNGVCQGNTTGATPLVSQQMVALAGQSDGLDMDQWAFIFTQVTGQPSPRDPGDIIAAAGPNPPSFPDGRATVMDIGTWLAFMNQNGAGISGIEGLAALHVANAWLV